MNTHLLRGLIVVVNLSLIGGTGFMGYEIFIKRSKVPKKEKVPAFDVTEYQIKTTAIERRSEASFAPIWITLRKAKPIEKKPVKKEPVVAKPVGPPPTPLTLVTRRYKLVGVTINKENPKRSTVFMKRKSGGNRILVKVGEAIPETPFTLMALAVASEDSIKATLRSKNGKTEDITMRRGDKK